MATALAEDEKLVATLVASDRVTASQMFGKPCLKINGKALVAQHLAAVVFKPSDAKPL